MSERHWIRSYGNSIPAEIDANAQPTVVAVVDAAIGRRRGRTAFRSAGNMLSFRELDARARAFLQLPLRVTKGSRIAAMLPHETDKDLPLASPALARTPVHGVRAISHREVRLAAGASHRAKEQES